MNYWLMKSEPEAFSIDDLARAPQKTTCWDGVRNYQARNMLRDQMKKGDLAFFYHSNCEVPGIAGIVEIVREGYPDHTAFDPEDHHFDAKSDPENPRWFMVDVKLKKKFSRVVSLRELKSCADKSLSGFQLLAKGNRLSVMPVTALQWKFIESLSQGK
ncbi:EVE domain-containing protein [Thioalkalivibrio sp. XN279]|uniref:EVE domain-containing protein n=1 Tax=Thioalkalivibrio sp. XN279 TaxID=2714953 RepID=UPI00140BF085|nr:EVE domain-containing protein [Thioalkalivibrio sp. XN279]NHA15145.1 EVE domain-containing protein [Thioalkalivibrio sp. XN279]